MKRVRTFCRICEAHCGLVAEVRGDHVERIVPDHEHPLTQGYSCVKGLGAGALHHDPDRVNHPLMRVDGELREVSWDEALRAIGQRVRSLRARHGDRAVGLYSGNPTFFSFQNVMFSSAFLEALGSPNHFASHSVDSNPKLDVATQMYGLSIIQPVCDIRHTEFFLCLGSNPVVSQMSVIHLPNAIGRLQEIEARGGRVVIVDPRRTETAARVGEHLSIRPGTDVYLLLGMLHCLAHEDRTVDASLYRYARGGDELLNAAEPWTPERCEALCGIEGDTIRELARAFRDADGGCLYMSTGVNMGPFGSLSFWLLQGLHLVAGQMDRRGGLVLPEGAFDAFQLAAWLGLGTENEERTWVSGWHQVAGAFPVGALAEEIEGDHPDRIRALFVSCGNPVHSVPGHDLRRALQRLDLLVCIDLYRSETAELADFVLPATDMLERSDFPVSWQVLQETPHAQYTEAVVPPKHDRRPEWRIFSDLAVACGASPLGRSLCNVVPHLNRLVGRVGAQLEPDHILALLLRWGGKTTLAELRAEPAGVMLPPNQPGTFLGQRLFTPDGRVRLDAPRLLADLPRLASYEREVEGEGRERLYLIGRRERKSHNSWMHNNRFIRHPRSNHALLHPDDAAERGIDDGARVVVASEEGSIELPVRLTESVARGVIAVPHGWGHGDSGLGHAKELSGDNINAVIPGGTMHMEPVSGQSVMLAHRVEVRPAAEELAG